MAKGGYSWLCDVIMSFEMEDRVYMQASYVVANCVHGQRVLQTIDLHYLIIYFGHERTAQQALTDILEILILGQSC